MHKTTGLYILFPTISFIFHFENKITSIIIIWNNGNITNFFKTDYSFHNHFFKSFRENPLDSIIEIHLPCKAVSSTSGKMWVHGNATKHMFQELPKIGKVRIQLKYQIKHYTHSLYYMILSKSK